MKISVWKYQWMKITVSAYQTWPSACSGTVSMVTRAHTYLSTHREIHIKAIAFQVNHDYVCVSDGSRGGLETVANCCSHTAHPHFLSPSIVLVLTHWVVPHVAQLCLCCHQHLLNAGSLCWGLPVMTAVSITALLYIWHVNNANKNECYVFSKVVTCILSVSCVY